jgi:hypothetical protein
LASGADLERAWRRAADANARYYRAVGRLYGDYVRAVAGATRGLAASRRRAAAAGAAAPPPPPAPVLALEAEAGSSASGIFVIENRSAERVSAPVEAAPLADPHGRTAAARPAFEPEVVTLAPGEQMLVQVTFPVDETLRVGADYRSTLRVPGLAGTSIPIVVRRLRSSSAAGRRAAT